MSVNINDNGILRKIAGGTLYADLPIGAEIMYEGTAVPNGYLACNGSTFSQSEYPELYAVLGSTTLPNRSDYIIRAKMASMPLDFEKNLSNPNLLDNPWFTVNQRGLTTYSVNGYTVDRWKSINSMLTVGVTSDGLTLTNTASGRISFRQPLESASVRGKLVTISIMLSDGTIIYGTGTFPTTEGTFVVNFGTNNSIYAQVTDQDETCFAIVIGNGESWSIRAAKLELGSVSTLANDAVPNYTTELLKCQRFFYNIVAGATTVVGTGFALDTTRCRIAFNLPTRMRVTQPTITYSTSITVVGHGATHAVSAIDSVQVSNGNIQPLTLTTTGLVQYNTYIAAIDSGNTISISADL